MFPGTFYGLNLFWPNSKLLHKIDFNLSNILGVVECHQWSIDCYSSSVQFGHDLGASNGCLLKTPETNCNSERNIFGKVRQEFCH